MISWFDQARERLEREYKEVNGQKESAMMAAVRDTLLEFCRQDEEFTQAVAQGGSFPDCMVAVAKGGGGSTSALGASRRAVSFYFPGAGIQFSMKIDLCDSVKDVPHPDGPGIVLDLSDFF